MRSDNLGWLYYRDYFEGFDFGHIKSENNKKEIEKKAKNIVNYTVKIPNLPNLGREKLRFNTTYPGLLIGSGYMHELKDIEGQLILGFHFDYKYLPKINFKSINFSIA